MRDAESLLDQVVSFSGGRIETAAVIEVLGVIPAEALSGILDALAEGNAAAALEGVERVLAGGTGPRQFVAEFVDYLRDLLVAKTCGAESKLLVRSAGEREGLAAAAGKWDQTAVIYAMQLLSETYARMARSPQTRGLLDVSIVKLAQVDDFLKLREMLDSGEPSDGGEASTRPAGRPREAERRRPFENAAAPTSGPHAASVETAWHDIVVAAGAGQVVGKILETSPVRVEGNRIRITLANTFALYKGMIEHKDIKASIEDAASKVHGSALRLEVTVAASEAEPREQETASGRRKAITDRALEDPSVQKIMEIFNGTLVDVEEADV